MGPFFSLSMAAKFETCHFSGFRIPPGHGKKIVKNDSKSYWIFSSKIESLFWDKKNSRKVPWTMIYRKVHKKGIVEESKRKKTRRTQKVTRAIVGASIELINKRKSIKPEQRKIQRETAIRKAKEERKKTKPEKKSRQQAAPGARQPRQKNSKGW